MSHHSQRSGPRNRRLLYARLARCEPLDGDVYVLVPNLGQANDQVQRLAAQQQFGAPGKAVAA